MQITKYADYSLRVLIFLAINPNSIIPMREIADFYDISMEHLRKVVHQLASIGYIDSQKGRNGGLSLRLRPDHIHIGHVLQSMEKTKKIVDCTSKVPCQFTPNCKLEKVLVEAQSAFYATLNNYTLEDVIGSSQMVEKVLFFIDHKS